MLITIGRETESMMKILEINNYPFSTNELKKKYRESCFKYHSDTGGKTASNEMFSKCKKAHDYLENLCNDIDIVKKRNKIIKTDMFDLTEQCKDCNGTGSIHYDTTIKCPNCNGEFFNFFFGNRGNGKNTIKCKWCNNGMFKQKNGRIVKCKICHGTGIFKIIKCRTCNGIGLINKKIERYCMSCGGEGKIHIKPMNPVIRKGAILF